MERRIRRGHGRDARIRCVALPILALVASGMHALAQEALAQGAGRVRTFEVTPIAIYRLTGIEGFVLGRYWRDTLLTGAPAGAFASDTPATRQTLGTLSGEVFVMTHGYVYHPNLMLLDFGVGPVFFRNTYSQNGPESVTNRTTYDMRARASFFREKPYRGAMFYERTNESYPVGPAQSLLTENTRYGFALNVLSPATPVPIHLDASRYQTKGQGTDQVIDDRLDSVTLRAERRWGRLGESNFEYKATRDDSRSGSVGLPIQSTRTETQTAILGTSLTFGERRQYDLVNTLVYNSVGTSAEEGALADNRTFRMDLNFRARATEALQTRARYQLDTIDSKGQSGGQSGTLNAFAAGATWQPTKNFSGTLDALASVNRNSGFDADTVGLNGNANYRRELPLGEFTANYGLAWYKRDNSAREAIAQVVGERHVLAGVAWVDLRRRQVLRGSVVVSNALRTQRYAEGPDYVLEVLGLVTRIRRVVGGAIPDGAEAAIDYSYDTGGTYATTELDNTVELRWGYHQIFSVYVRYGDFSPRLDSGAPTAPLNPATNKLVGTRVDIPFELLSEILRVGGYGEWQDRREVISPYRQSTYEAYVESTIPYIPRGGLRLGARQQRTEYDLTPQQDVRQTTLMLRAWSRFRNGIMFEVEATQARDAGSPQVTREYLQGKARASWQVRKLLLTLDAGWTKESQSGFARTHKTAEIKLRRDF